MSRLFVSRLPYALTNDALRAYFARFGEVQSARVTIDRFTGRSKGFGFVTFESEDAASKVLSEPHVLEGRPIHVAVATNTRSDTRGAGSEGATHADESAARPRWPGGAPDKSTASAERPPRFIRITDRPFGGFYD